MLMYSFITYHSAKCRAAYQGFDSIRRFSASRGVDWGLLCRVLKTHGL